MSDHCSLLQHSTGFRFFLRHPFYYAEVKKATENSSLKEYLKDDNRITAIFENGTKLTVDFDELKYTILK